MSIFYLKRAIYVDRQINKTRDLTFPEYFNLQVNIETPDERISNTDCSFEMFFFLSYGDRITSKFLNKIRVHYESYENQ